MSARGRDPWPGHCRGELVKALRAAADLFPHPGEDSPERIHEARKALKSARALARLFSGPESPAAYEVIGAVDTARRSIGSARNLDVMPRVLQLLAGELDPALHALLENAISFEREVARVAHADVDVGALVAQLRTLARSTDRWNLDGMDAAAPLKILRAQYRGARRAGKKAFDDLGGAETHALRTLVVDLGCQLAAFEPAWPSLIGVMIGELQKLRQTLGDINDLAVLGEFAAGRRDAPVARLSALALGVERRQKRLNRRARAVFERCFAERPGAFERRLAAYIANSKTGPKALGALRDSAP